MGTKLIYVDDSGAVETGFVTYSFCMVDIADWRRALESWLAWRQQLNARDGIPKAYELHATHFANGRGDPSLRPDWNRRKAHRHRVMDETMAMLAGEDWLSVGTVYSQTGARGHAFARERERVYLELVQTLDALLAGQDDFGIVVMDGDGSDDSYITAHRQLDLATRWLIEDPGFQALPPQPVDPDDRSRRLRHLPASAPASRQALCLALVSHPADPRRPRRATCGLTGAETP